MSKNIVNQDELLLAEAFLTKEFERIVDWAVGDIKRCCRLSADGSCAEGGALVGAFILWCCAIEYFGGLYTGNPNDKRTFYRYKEFVTKYMPSYDHNKLYDLRWSLLHYYSPHHFALVHENNIEVGRKYHLAETSRGIILHLGCSVFDFEKAVDKYKVDLQKNPELKIKAFKYWKKQLPIMPLEVSRVDKYKLNTIIDKSSLEATTASGTVSEDEWLRQKSIQNQVS